MRLRNALTVGVTAATIAPAVLTASTATAAMSMETVRAAASVAVRPAGGATLAGSATVAATTRTGVAPAGGALTGSAAVAGTTRTAVAPVAVRPAGGVLTGSAAIAGTTRTLVAPVAVRPAAVSPAPPTDKPAGPSAAATLPAPTGKRPADRQPACGKAPDRDFPIDTRIHGGPPTHHAGGGFETWSVDLANITGEACQNIHPVIIITGHDPGLTPARITLEFYDDKAALWRPVALETTAEGEVVGVLDGDGRFPGLAVPARKSVTAKVRFRLAADAPPNQVTVNAAVVQRQGDDGDWVGESGDYSFAVLGADGSGTEPSGIAPSRTDGTRTDAGVTPDELAGTGDGSLMRLGGAFGAVLLGGGVLLLASRRLRTGRR
ncbi:hypothetical protein J7E87_09240 [Streptomyces sp. ISL-1]|uniref:hypothetical protein n=1 Tax=Streptomyces sp. ISL-1 TaxID=2817657 RepID=UPI001BEA95D8|nr:hypothetical protein [Streptomyces sp. ISL-1]MBT2389611.1 hypothetical protein [Streptomyces sp. ISL-1]